MLLKNLDEMASLCFVLDLNGSFGLVVVNLGSTENFIPDGLSLAGTGF